MSTTETAATVDHESGFSIAEASEATGTSADTLRYYERAGIMPTIGRNQGGHRSYSSNDLGWITFIRRLRATGMTIQRIAEYTTMVRHGQGTTTDRRRIIEQHRTTVATNSPLSSECLTARSNTTKPPNAASTSTAAKNLCATPANFPR